MGRFGGPGTNQYGTKPRVQPHQDVSRIRALAGPVEEDDPEDEFYRAVAEQATHRGGSDEESGRAAGQALEQMAALGMDQELGWALHPGQERVSYSVQTGQRGQKAFKSASDAIRHAGRMCNRWPDAKVTVAGGPRGSLRVLLSHEPGQDGLRYLMPIDPDADFTTLDEEELGRYLAWYENVADDAWDGAMGVVAQRCFRLGEERMVRLRSTQR